MFVFKFIICSNHMSDISRHHKVKFCFNILQTNGSTPRNSITSINHRIVEETLAVNNLEHTISNHIKNRGRQLHISNLQFLH